MAVSPLIFALERRVMPPNDILARSIPILLLSVKRASAKSPRLRRLVPSVVSSKSIE